MCCNDHDEDLSPINVTTELDDLMKIYTDSIKKMDQNYEYRISSLVDNLRGFVRLYDERQSLISKKERLQDKIAEARGDDENEDGDDE